MGFFFKWPFPFWHILWIFQDSFIFGEAATSHFFRVTTVTQHLLFRSSSFFWAAVFFEELLFQKSLFRNGHFSRAKLLPSSHFLRMWSYFGKLLLGTATFLAKELFRIKVSTDELLFQSRYFCIASTFSEKLHFGKVNFSEK